MRIGIMLRHLNQHGGGVLVYTQNLLRELLALDSPHEFVLIYRDPDLLGMFGNGKHVREVVYPAPTRYWWDQVAMLQAEQREKLDVLFNPKYSVPLLARAKTVFVVHGLDWYLMPWGSKPLDRLNHRYLVPLYARKASAVISVSDTAREHAIRFLGVKPERMRTVYLGVNEIFREPVTEEMRVRVREMYGLPERYFLYVGQIYPPKNFGRLIQAYARVGPRMGVHLVVAGTHTFLSEEEIALIDRMGISEWVLRPGWIEQSLLPAFYVQAEALVMPSLYEGCPGPVMEAMVTGCPVITSNRFGTLELAGEAAVLVDPESVESIAAALEQVATDASLRERMILKGYARSSRFSYRACARETLEVLTRVTDRDYKIRGLGLAANGALEPQRGSAKVRAVRQK